jgi:hypothetical protein
MRTHNLLISGILACGAVATGADNVSKAAGPADIDKLGWLAGHWCQDRDGKRIEEQWLPPSGGLLIGMGRTVAGGKARSFEFMRIEIRDGVVIFVAQPEGVPPTPFRLTAAGADWARFENPAHDFPKRVEYRRTPAGLHAEISGPGKDGGEKVIPFEYGACGP